MKKILLTAAAFFMLTFMGCSGSGEPEPTAGATASPEANTDIVAIVDDELILKDEVTSLAEDYYASMGTDESAEDKEELYSSLLDGLIRELVERHKADELKYTELSDEDMALALEYREQLFDERYAYFYDGIKAETPDADEDTLIEYTDAAVLLYIQETGETDEQVLESYVYEIALANMYDDLTCSASVSEAELIAGYDERVAADEMTYTEHPDYFASDKTTNLIYYNLPGYRYVKHILLNDAETAEKVLGLTETQDFDALMAEYTSDAGSADFINGFAVCEDCELYTEGFADAAMALESVGDISGVIELSDGFHIIKYVADIPEGAEPLDTMRASLEEELLQQKRNDIYAKLLTEWTEQADIKYYYDILYQ